MRHERRFRLQLIEITVISLTRISFCTLNFWIETLLDDVAQNMTRSSVATSVKTLLGLEFDVATSAAAKSCGWHWLLQEIGHLLFEILDFLTMQRSA